MARKKNQEIESDNIIENSTRIESSSKIENSNRIEWLQQIYEDWAARHDPVSLVDAENLFCEEFEELIPESAQQLNFRIANKLSKRRTQ